ncbi:MAG TPA: ATP-binding protein [Syntrophomonas sp.]|nr:ATP-binding protein [Syntrophomonas sp.]
MKQLLILSGKGGTGKTTVAGAFIYLSKVKACADCDVDAPNLHLLAHQSEPPERDDYYGMPKAKIDPDWCIGCGQCRENCRFDAIADRMPFQVSSFACEGCGVCAATCPVGAIFMEPAAAGELALYRDGGSVLSTARLYMGSGTSGKLVTEVKKRMRNAADDAELAIIDGSPGIGCPVIASISGVDMVLIVAEPSLSGISDMERIVKTAGIFHTKVAICVNKYDLNAAKTIEIREYCRVGDIPFTGMIPFDEKAVQAVNSGKSIANVDCPSGSAVREVFQSTLALLFEESEKL